MGLYPTPHATFAIERMKPSTISSSNVSLVPSFGRTFLASTTYNTQDGESYIRKLTINLKGNDLNHLICNLCLGASVYHMERKKQRSFSTNMLTKERIVENNRKAVTHKGAMFTNMKLNYPTAETTQSWSLPNCIFKQKR